MKSDKCCMLSGKKSYCLRNIIKKIKINNGKSTYKNDGPISKGNVNKRPLHALLEDVKNTAVATDNAITAEVPFLKILDLLSNKIAMENGKMILTSNQRNFDY